MEPRVQAILGINCFSHDTAACLLVDGEVAAMAEQERFDRVPHSRSFPDDAVRFCLGQASMTMADVDIVAFAQRPGLDLARGVGDAVTRAAPKRLAAQAYIDGRLMAREVAFRRRWAYRGRLEHVGHHDAHASSAFFASPFDSAAVLSIDRGGDYLSATLRSGSGNRMQTIHQVHNPHSVGEIYSALTWYLGFRANADEGKVMGLAPYGTDRYVKQFRDLLSFSDEGRFAVNFKWFRYQREGCPVSPLFMGRYGPPRQPESEISDRDKDLAFAVQSLTEDAGLHIARWLRDRVGATRLCIAGGVALNSVMNYRILNEAGFDELFVQPASSDAGNALGAALWVYHHVLGMPRKWVMEHPFIGPPTLDAPAGAAIASAVRGAQGDGISARTTPDPAAEAARLLAAGKVVGWYQGRAEVGPRALGARSILADPRRAEMRDVVNDRVKHREWFRPFAPSVLDERGGEYFVNYRSNPFMLLVEKVRPDKHDVIPAVTHVDGTGRLQSVTAGFNPLFHRLIEQFDGLTGVPVVLNTSFNVRGEPMVNRPEEALADFAGTAMDALVIGGHVLEKQPGA
ncbi:MAG: carbamoyltransferase family protein [Acidimicrobiales bacterium]